MLRLTVVSSIVLLGTSFSFGQSVDEFQAKVAAKLAERTMPEVQVGQLMCEGINGDLKVCEGVIEESIVGIATSSPYVTLNKPASPDASKFVFNALVSNENGAIVKGDGLKAGKDGKLVRSDYAEPTYAVALSDADAVSSLIQIKILRK